jgi:hypothetical protein
MPNDDDAPSRYLAEWYTTPLNDLGINELARRVEESLATMPAPPGRPTLLYALEVPGDAYAFAVFAAGSVDLVSQACLMAGLPADRVTTAVEAQLGSP